MIAKPDARSLQERRAKHGETALRFARDADAGFASNAAERAIAGCFWPRASTETTVAPRFPRLHAGVQARSPGAIRIGLAGKAAGMIEPRDGRSVLDGR